VWERRIFWKGGKLKGGKSWETFVRTKSRRAIMGDTFGLTWGEAKKKKCVDWDNVKSGGKKKNTPEKFFQKYLRKEGADKGFAHAGCQGCAGGKRNRFAKEKRGVLLSTGGAKKREKDAPKS